MMNVMVDLETLGTRPGCIVLSIGAVEFDERGIGREFYAEILQDSSRLYGLHADPSTLGWWRKQNDAARAVLTRTENEGDKLPAALQKFSDWCHEITNTNNLAVWGDGASFDNPILVECYRVTGLYPPWRFWNDRCYRTLKNLGLMAPVVREGTYHHALDDARVQARHASKILAMLRGNTVAETPAYKWDDAPTICLPHDQSGIPPVAGE
jgi:hypothetical protein